MRDVMDLKALAELISQASKDSELLKEVARLVGPHPWSTPENELKMVAELRTALKRRFPDGVPS
jgi:hypothetical protein